ncbi:MAG: nitroreductase [Candidatus Cohnella colombiensis]|uniref:Putative NAD(P)H nitroreductase n=1 Tax=Candidatus Cohnella colombiensis TaxID=3121368 RepID=A0AA95EXZ9_9BACL|nr:MAG: nitroreductase [Cohnella sp.]
MSNLQQIIQGRRSIGKVKSDPVSRVIIEKLIEAAVWAPSHHGTEPWKFIVLTGDGRRVLGQAYADIALSVQEGLTADERTEQQAKEIGKAYRSPVVIVAICSPSDLPRVDRREEFAAVHAAVQNLLLAAHDCGLGAVWRTGAPAYHPIMKSAFNVAQHEEIVGLVYVGYPDMIKSDAKRTAGTAKTQWIEQ